MSATVILVSGQLISGTLSLSATIFMARFCGPVVFGFCAISILALGVLQDIVDFGMSSYAARELASARISSREFIDIRNGKNQLSLAILVLWPVLAVIMPTRSIFSAFLICLYPVCWLRTNYIQQHLIAIGDISNSVKLQIVERLTWNTVVIFHFLHFDPYLVYISPIILGLVTHGTFGEIILRGRFGPFNSIKSSHALDSLSSRHFGIVSILSDANNLDSIIVAKFSTLFESSKYSLAGRFRSPLTIVFQSIATHLRPVAASKDRSKISRAVKQDAPIAVGGVLMVAFLSFSLYENSERIFGSSYAGVGSVLLIVTLCAIPLGISSIAATFLSAVGEEKFVSRLSICTIPANIVLLIYTSNKHGAFGAAIGVLLVNVALAILYSFQSWKAYKNLD